MRFVVRFLIGAGLFLRSMQKAQEINPGFESKNLFQYNFDVGALLYEPEHGQQFFGDAVERAKSVPGVADVPPCPPMASSTEAL